MNKFLSLLFICLTVSLARAGTSETKNSFSSEKAMFKQAERYYVKKEFEKAKLLYAQLISNHKDNYKLNYCYGICLLITDKDKASAVKYLEEASKSIHVWDDVWYYLGRAYLLNGEYTKALSSYDQFLKMVSVKQAMRWEAMHQMEMCKNAKIFVKKADTLSIVESRVVSADQVYSAYQFAHDDRILISLPEEFSTPKDKKNKNCDLAYLSAGGTKMVFTSYGKDGGMTTDIYMAVKKEDGTWGKPQRMSNNINTKYDEAFPTLSEDGGTIYFSSKGHNSMGGFDIFRSVYYPQTKQWSKPVNMGMPINSTDDDIYYVGSEIENIAYYSSRKGCNAGELEVFKIRINEDTKTMLVISGEVVNEYAAPYREAKIKITRQSDGEVISEFTSDPVNGKYRFTLPEAGSYRVSVRVEGFGPMAQSISFSPNAKGRVRQTAYVSKDSAGFDYLRIVNIFDESFNGTITSIGKDSTGKDIYGTVSTDVNKTASTGYEPITMYNVSGLPPFSEASKEKLDTYFAEQHKNRNDSVLSSLQNLNSSAEKGTNYKVQIGTFMHQTVEQVYGKLVELGFDDLSYYTNKKGWNIFYTGHAKDISSTLRLKDIVVSYGFDDAFITVFENGRPSRAGRKK